MRTFLLLQCDLVPDASLFFSSAGKLGTYEAIDQIAVARTWASTKLYVDKRRVGIWGWSFGGCEFELRRGRTKRLVDFRADKADSSFCRRPDCEMSRSRFRSAFPWDRCRSCDGLEVSLLLILRPFSLSTRPELTSVLPLSLPQVLRHHLVSHSTTHLFTSRVARAQY